MRVLEFFWRNYDIVQFGTARSGSTLCYNAIKFLKPDAKVRKAHRLKHEYRTVPVIVTLRDPYDSLVSLIKSRGDAITDEAVEHHASVLYENGFKKLGRLKTFPFALRLNYDDFVNDHGFLLRQVGQYLKVPVSEDQIAAFAERFDVTRVRTETAGKPFEAWDKETMLHGSHVSATLGRSGEGRHLTPAQRETARRILRL